MRAIVTCPIVILAASRNERVSGRTRVLVVSTSTRNGAIAVGALAGVKLASVFQIFVFILDATTADQNGIARESVNTR